MTAGAPSDRQRIIVIGAGVVGVCCALWLQRKGHRVVLVDGNPPGSGASYGNACTIAVHCCVPVNHPTLFWRLPQLMFSRNAPLNVDPIYALRHLPWMLRFLKQCRPRAVQKTVVALGQILGRTYAGLDPLIQMTGCARLFRDNGCLYAYRDPREFIAAQQDLQIRRAHGVRYTQLDGDEIHELEPCLKMRFAGGALFDDSKSVSNPQTLVDTFFAYFQAQGGYWRNQDAKAVELTRDGVAVSLADGERVLGSKVVLAAGAFSKGVAGTGAARLPLETERGYHVQFSGQQGLVNRPVHWVGSGFYATPTSEGLRCAGTVEIAGLSTQKNPHTLAYITGRAQRMFDLHGAGEQTWLGYRPTFPDALPVIGTNSRSDRILYAFGHQHLGLTLAGITGLLISELVDATATTVDVSPFSAARFD